MDKKLRCLGWKLSWSFFWCCDAAGVFFQQISAGPIKFLWKLMDSEKIWMIVPNKQTANRWYKFLKQTLEWFLRWKFPLEITMGSFPPFPRGVKSTAYRSFHWITGSTDLWPLRTFAWCFHGGKPRRHAEKKSRVLLQLCDHAGGKISFFGRLVGWKEVMILT